MPIINNLPCGGSEVPDGYIPAVFKSSTLGVFVQYGASLTTHIIKAANLPTSTSTSGLVTFVPIKNFQAKWHLNSASGISDYYTFEKNKEYKITYYTRSSKYYFQIDNITDNIHVSDVTPSSGYTTNRWSDYLLTDITF